MSRHDWNGIVLRYSPDDEPPQRDDILWAAGCVAFVGFLGIALLSIAAALTQ